LHIAGFVVDQVVVIWPVSGSTISWVAWFCSARVAAAQYATV
jgi:hypothetical protein